MKTSTFNIPVSSMLKLFPLSWFSVIHGDLGLS